MPCAGRWQVARCAWCGWRRTSAARRCLRGTAEELAQIDELVKALDVAPDKLSKCEVAGLYLIPLQRTEARSVASLLTQLGFRAGVLQLGKRHAIAIMDPDARKDIEAIVASEEASAAEKSEAEAK